MKVSELITKLNTFNKNSKVEIVVEGIGSTITDVELEEESKIVIIY
jgi:hypothetical protein